MNSTELNNYNPIFFEIKSFAKSPIKGKEVIESLEAASFHHLLHAVNIRQKRKNAFSNVLIWFRSKKRRKRQR